MLPLVLNPVNLKVGLAGRGPERDRRAALLAEAGVEARLLPDTVPDALLASLQVLFVAGLPEGESRDLATRARARWRSEGLSPAQVSQNVRDMLVRMGWL